MMKQYRFLEYAVGERIGYIILNRPEKRNALNEVLVAELKDALDRARDDREVKVIVLKAKGKAFSAGADLEYLHRLQQNSYEDNLADSRNLMGLFQTIYQHKKAVIAQVEGHAIAGGCGLATVCDFCYAVTGAKFGYSEVRIGFIPALVSTFLTRKIGEGRARELLLSGNLIDAAEAARIGLITAVADATEIEKVVADKAAVLRDQTSGQSITLTKYLLDASRGMNMADNLALAAELNAKARASEDCRKGIAAFLEKKAVEW